MIFSLWCSTILETNYGSDWLVCWRWIWTTGHQLMITTVETTSWGWSVIFNFLFTVIFDFFIHNTNDLNHRKQSTFTSFFFFLFFFLPAVIVNDTLHLSDFTSCQSARHYSCFFPPLLTHFFQALPGSRQKWTGFSSSARQCLSWAAVGGEGGVRGVRLKLREILGHECHESWLGALKDVWGMPRSHLFSPLHSTSPLLSFCLLSSRPLLLSCPFVSPPLLSSSLPSRFFSVHVYIPTDWLSFPLLSV